MANILELATPRRVIGTGLLLSGLSLGGFAIAEHEQAQQPYTVVSHKSMPDTNVLSQICLRSELGQKPDCGTATTAHVSGVEVTRVATHSKNEGLDREAALIGGAACFAILAGVALEVPESWIAENEEPVSEQV